MALPFLDELRKFPKIIVSGPQRSGTTFACAVLQEELGYDKIHMPYSDRKRCKQWIDELDRVLIHGPGMAHALVWLTEMKDDVAVVWMKRKVEDIIASERRIGWAFEAHELSQYHLKPNHGPISKVKYHFWDKVQRHLIKNKFEVEYESLKDHPLWVDKDQRRKFDAYQVGPDKRVRGVM